MIIIPNRRHRRESSSQLLLAPPRSRSAQAGECGMGMHLEITKFSRTKMTDESQCECQSVPCTASSGPSPITLTAERVFDG
jgi:hypothetical protein